MSVLRLYRCGEAEGVAGGVHRAHEHQGEGVVWREVDQQRARGERGGQQQDEVGAGRVHARRLAAPALRPRFVILLILSR